MTDRTGTERNFSAYSWLRPFTPWAVCFLVLLHCIGWIFGKSLAQHEPQLGVDPVATLRHGQLWRLTTGIVVIPSKSWELTSVTILSLILLGYDRERKFGSWMLIAFYLSSGIVTHLLWSASAIVWDWQQSLSSVPAAVALAGDRLFRAPRTPLGLLPQKWAIPGWIVAVGVLLASAFYAGFAMVEYSAMVFAIVYALFWDQVTLPERSRTQPKINDVIEPDEQDALPASEDNRVEFDKRVDELLEKISQLGYGSLTEAEIQLLLEASQRYRQQKELEDSE